MNHHFLCVSWAFFGSMIIGWPKIIRRLHAHKNNRNQTSFEYYYGYCCMWRISKNSHKGMETYRSNFFFLGNFILTMWCRELTILSALHLFLDTHTLHGWDARIQKQKLRLLGNLRAKVKPYYLTVVTSLKSFAQCGKSFFRYLSKL